MSISDSPIARTGATFAASTFARPLIVSVAYYVAAVLALALAERASGFATIWPASGILLAALLLAKPRVIPAHLAGAAVASVLANLQFGASPWTAFGFTLANFVEPLIVLWLLRGRSRRYPLFGSPQGLARISLAALAASLTSSAIASLVHGAPTLVFAASWCLSDLLGMLVITPLVFIGAEYARGRERASLGSVTVQATGWLGLVAGTAAATFSQGHYPLLFLPMMVVLLAVFRLGAIGGAAGLVVVAVIGSMATDANLGPVAMIGDGRAAQVLFLQFYLLALFAAALPIAALLATRDRLTATLAAQNHLLTLAESTAHVGHWRYDTVEQTMFWSEEVYRIHGHKGDTPADPIAARESYHPEDQPVVQAALEAALNEGKSFDFTARVIRPDGTVCHVLSRGEVERAPSGDIVGVFGMLQDITVHVTVEQALDSARAAAEEAAQRATFLAETDQLTGLPNRRKVLDVLDRAIAKTGSGGAGLSVVIFDLDYFKQVNDTYGHATGDAVLRRVAAAARSAVAGRGTVGRMGGEEFVIVLPDTAPAQAAAIAEDVRVAILDSAKGTALASVEGPQVSASFGIAAILTRTRSVSETSKDVLSRADHALYAAKRAGRNTSRQAA